MTSGASWPLDLRSLTFAAHLRSAKSRLIKRHLSFTHTFPVPLGCMQWLLLFVSCQSGSKAGSARSPPVFMNETTMKQHNAAQRSAPIQEDLEFELKLVGRLGTRRLPRLIPFIDWLADWLVFIHKSPHHHRSRAKTIETGSPSSIDDTCLSGYHWGRISVFWQCATRIRTDLSH